MSFRYGLSEGCDDYEIERAFVSSIVFPFGRYGEIDQLVSFKTPVTIRQAIKHAEEWMNQKITKQEYDDLCECQGFYAGEIPLIDELSCRGDVMGENRYIEQIEVEGSQICLVTSDI